MPVVAKTEKGFEIPKSLAMRFFLEIAARFKPRNIKPEQFFPRPVYLSELLIAPYHAQGILNTETPQSIQDYPLHNAWKDLCHYLDYNSFFSYSPVIEIVKLCRIRLTQETEPYYKFLEKLHCTSYAKLPSAVIQVLPEYINYVFSEGSYLLKCEPLKSGN